MGNGEERMFKELKLNDNVSELHIALKFADEKSAKKEFENALRIINDTHANVLCVEIFAGEFVSKTFNAWKKSLKQEFPVNWILPLSENKDCVLAGAHITALRGTKPEIIKVNKDSLAVKYSDGFFNYLRTFGIVETINSTPYARTYANLESLENVMKTCEYSYNDIARTWFYNNDILSWYDDFNESRTLFYNERKVFDGLLPASTGIGAPNRMGSLIMSGALALQKTSNENCFVQDVESPLQCGAPKYGSSFARAIEIDTPFGKRVMVSGTASIAQGGKSAHIDDIEKQTELTMNVISEILKSREMTFENTTRAVVYCLKPEYYKVFEKWSEKNVSIPHCPAYSIVCRSDLLIEVELDAFLEK